MGFSVESHLVKEGRIGYFSHVLLNSRQSRGIIRQSFKSKNLTATHKHVIDQEQGFAWIKILNPIKQQGETNVIKKRHWVQRLYLFTRQLLAFTSFVCISYFPLIRLQVAKNVKSNKYNRK